MRSAIPDIDAVTRVIRETAEAEILPRFRRLKNQDIRQKTGPRDLVTVADMEAEKQLTRRLVDLLPGSRVVGEEAAAENPEILSYLSEDRPVWVIDPVDGTLNFANGRGAFAVIVALVLGTETVAGWIHEPMSGKTVAARRGEGAWQGDTRMRVAPPAAIGEMTGALYVGPKRAPALYTRLEEIGDQLGPKSFTSCAGAEYLGLARGTSHYAIFTRLLPWDHAAGCLIHQEAGGYSANFQGEPYRPATGKGPHLLAPDKQTSRQLHTLSTGEKANLPG